jgi:hypothetical protein
MGRCVTVKVRKDRLEAVAAVGIVPRVVFGTSCKRLFFRSTKAVVVRCGFAENNPIAPRRVG